ncbi:hypothetical protein DL768_003633 [Monosporascus sp. mg162]|nr:hypothetical protein DL768_003633 [Monosporascus sp. mg162]
MEHIKGVTQRSFMNVGFPHHRPLVVDDIKGNTHVDSEERSAVPALAGHRRISRPGGRGEIADDGAVQTHAEHGRTIEAFGVHSRTVAKATFGDAGVYGKTGKAYGDLPVSEELERRIAGETGDKPALDAEQWAAAEICSASPGRSQPLCLDDGLEARAREALESDSLHVDDPNISRMLDVVRKCIPKAAFNTYRQARRDAFAVFNGLFHHGSEHIYSQRRTAPVVRSPETHSTLQPVSVPDMTRHGLHWVHWLVWQSDLNLRNPQNNPPLAESGICHFGGRCGIGDSDSRVGPGPTQSLLLGLEGGQQEHDPLRDPTDGRALRHARRPLQPRNLQAARQRDLTPWARGLRAGGRVPGRGGTWSRARAVRAACSSCGAGSCGTQPRGGPGGAASSSRARRTRRSGGAVARRDPSTAASTPKLEDTLPENLGDEDEPVRIPERYPEESDSEEASGSSRGVGEAPRPPHLRRRHSKRDPLRKYRNHSSSDADAEKSEGGGKAVSTKKQKRQS